MYVIALNSCEIKSLSSTNSHFRNDHKNSVELRSVTKKACEIKDFGEEDSEFLLGNI